MFCLPIKSASCLKNITEKNALLEFRLDYFSDNDLQNLRHLRESCRLPLIFTLRKKSEGGAFSGSEELRLKRIREYAHYHPTYLDIEWDVPAAFTEKLQSDFPHIAQICSYHNFEKTPEDLETLLLAIQKRPATLYKIACVAKSSSDALRMLELQRNFPHLIAISMGTLGEVSRILGPKMGAPWTYVKHENATAQGQLPLNLLQNTYGIERFNQKTALFGLIGNPVSQSLSHLSHNAAMRALELNAAYIKIPVAVEELSFCLDLAKKLNFSALSVTMPLKEAVLPFIDILDPCAQKIGAANTLLFQGDKIYGFNTDGIGALDAIENLFAVQDKHIVILGAGGSARAICYEALLRGAHVTLLNRTSLKAESLANRLGAQGGSLNSLSQIDYDILINATPHEMPIPTEHMRSHRFVMDIKTLPKMSTFLKVAEKKKCHLIFGYEMFINQACQQFNLWFPKSIDHFALHSILSRTINTHLG